MAGKSGFQFYAAAMEKQSLTQGQGHKEMLRRVAAHRHGEDFNADIDHECSHRMAVWCAKTAWAYWRQALMVEFVNNREQTIAKGVAKAISRCAGGDGANDDRVKTPLWRVMRPPPPSFKKPRPLMPSRLHHDVTTAGPRRTARAGKFRSFFRRPCWSHPPARAHAPTRTNTLHAHTTHTAGFYFHACLQIEHNLVSAAECLSAGCWQAGPHQHAPAFASRGRGAQR